MSVHAHRYIADDVLTSAVTSAYRFSPNSQNEVDNKGEMHALITVIGEENIQAERIAKFVWDSIADTYFYNPFSTVIDNLKMAVEQGSKKAAEMIKNESGNGVNLSFSLVVFKGRGAYITVFGEQQSFLYKNGGIVKVSEIITQNKGVVASMAWSDSDLLFMSSPNLLDGISQIVEMGDSNEEVFRNLAKGSQDLTGHESLLILSGKDYGIEKEEKPKPKPLIQTLAQPIAKESMEEDLPQSDEVKGDEISSYEPIEVNIPVQRDEPVKEKVKIDYSQYLEKTKGFILRIWAKILPFSQNLLTLLKKVPDTILNIFGKVGNRINGYLMGRFGKQHWYKQIMSKLSLSTFGKKSVGIGMKIDGYKDNDLRKKRFSILFFVLLGVGIIYGLFNLSSNAAQKRELHKYAVEVMDNLEKQLNDVEKIRLTDQPQAQLIMFELKDSINTLDGKELALDDSLRYAKLKEKYSGLDDVLANRVILRESSDNIESFLDGRAEFGDTANLSDITTYKDEFQNEFLFVTDSGMGVVYKIGLSDRSIVRIGDDKKVLSQPKYVDYGVSGVFVFDEVKGMARATFSKNGSIGSFSIINGLDRDVLGNMEVNDLAIITSSDNVYLLSRSESAIMKSGKSGTGYAYPFQYISGKSLANANNMANDISIYATTQGSRGLERYSYDYNKGATVLNRVTIEGLDTDPTVIKAAYTAAIETSTMYIFDENLKRIVQFEKPIEGGENVRHPNQMLVLNQFIYKGERNDVFNDVKEIAADYSESNLYVLDGNKIWRVKLK